jgi:hypothetical protein
LGNAWSVRSAAGVANNGNDWSSDVGASVRIGETVRLGFSTPVLEARRTHAWIQAPIMATDAWKVAATLDAGMEDEGSQADVLLGVERRISAIVSVAGQAGVRINDDISMPWAVNTRVTAHRVIQPMLGARGALGENWAEGHAGLAVQHPSGVGIRASAAMGSDQNDPTWRAMAGVTFQPQSRRDSVSQLGRVDIRAKDVWGREIADATVRLGHETWKSGSEKELPVGSFAATVSAPGHKSRRVDIAIEGGILNESDVTLTPATAWDIDTGL